MVQIDSAFWKTELFPIIEEIERLSRFSRFNTRIANALERQIMFALFSVRTLIERHKLSQELLSQRIDVVAYPKRTPKPVTWLNNHDIDELFDVNAPKKRQLTLNFLCNQVIHSYILIPLQDGRKFTDVLVCSDRDRNRWLYVISMNRITKIIRDVAFDYPSRMNITYNPKRQDYDIKNYK
ncbi:MAG: hypothetical protein DME49_10590 [Verrucomicrobia bacterium]|nr:MAG: hypothetical protein DME49_10590 [Verrucomicrobiota bacterium]